MEFNLADLWERVADAVPDQRGDRLRRSPAHLRRGRRARQPARAPPRRARHRRRRSRRALPRTTAPSTSRRMLAAFKLRAVPINVNYRYVEDELRYLLDDSDAKAVVFHREFAPTLAAVRADAPAAHHVRRWSTTAVGADIRRRARRRRVRGCARGRVTRARLRAALGRRPVHPLHRRHHRHAQGRDVARRGHLLRRVRRREPRRRADRHARRRSSTPSTSSRRGLPACPFMHGTAHWMAFGTLYSGGTRRASRPTGTSTRARSGELIDARAASTFLVIVGDAFARPLVEALRPPRPARRRHAAHRGALGRRGPVAGGRRPRGSSGSRRRCSSTASARRRPAGRARASRRPAAPIEPRAALPRERRDHRARRRPPPGRAGCGRQARPARATCRSGTTRTRRRPPTRSP